LLLFPKRPGKEEPLWWGWGAEEEKAEGWEECEEECEALLLWEEE
jgi:hypothetical protein